MLLMSSREYIIFWAGWGVGGWEVVGGLAGAISSGFGAAIGIL